MIHVFAKHDFCHLFWAFVAAHTRYGVWNSCRTEGLRAF